jgi:hypothetical protein
MIHAIIVAGGVIYACSCEWTLHRYFMHRPFFGFRYPFEAHSLVHHQVFKSDVTYHVQREADKKTIPMKYWNGPAIVAVCAIPMVFLSWLLGMWSIVGIVALVSLAYYGAYEYMHWCMHLPLPKRRVVESWPVIGWIFYRLNGHHLLHHRYMHKNYNVVLPLADLCLGTLILRSKTHFAQARGISVPDVQPK